MKNKLMSNSGIKFLCILFLLIFSEAYAFSADSGSAAYVQGCQAYAEGDWDSAVFLLKKAVAYASNDTADANYMLISAEIYAGDEKAALADCDSFLVSFPNSIYVPRIQFMKGKTLYNLGEYEKTIVVLSDFCHQYPDHELYASALFYIAESFYTGYKYDEAQALYETIVTKYPDSEKVSAAQYRMDSISQHAREEKLLYLLKQTGEEYLAAKEDYEKQLRLYNSEAINTTREKLAEAQLKNKELEDQIKALEDQILQLKNDRERMATENQQLANELANSNAEAAKNSDSVKLLKEKANLIQQLLDSNKNQ